MVSTLLLVGWLVVLKNRDREGKRFICVVVVVDGLMIIYWRYWRLLLALYLYLCDVNERWIFFQLFLCWLSGFIIIIILFSTMKIYDAKTNDIHTLTHKEKHWIFLKHHHWARVFSSSSLIHFGNKKKNIEP